MSKKSIDGWKALAITAVWVAVGVASLKLGFFTLGIGIVAYLATLSIVEA